MKKIVFLLAIAVSIFSCNEKKKAYPKNADVLSDNLKGDVEETISKDYKTDSSGATGAPDSCCIIITKYDINGYVTDYSSNAQATPDKDRDTYTHDPEGRVTGLKIMTNGHLSSEVSIKSENGKYVSAVEVDSAHKLKNYYTGITENEFGQLTGFTKHNADSSISATAINTFDNQIYTGGEMKDSTGKIIYQATVKLDDKKNPLEINEKNTVKDSTTTMVTKYRYDNYDKEGNWTQRTQIDVNGKPVKVTKREITYYKD